VRCRRGLAQAELWQRIAEVADSSVNGAGAAQATDAGSQVRQTQDDPKKLAVPKDMRNRLVPLAIVDARSARPVAENTSAGEDALVYWLMFTEKVEGTRAWLQGQGWQPAPAWEVATPGETPV
jgi:hypothetical protein